jgi:hypothetical protein
MVMVGKGLSHSGIESTAGVPVFGYIGALDLYNNRTKQTVDPKPFTQGGSHAE